ncbi:MAG: hypothetical protein WBX38_21170 [Candidatus Sulfotelmatobacter sp.]
MIDPVTALTLVLAALSALLTVLAIIIGVAAVWGYIGLRDSVKEMASKKVDEAMKLKLKEYPASADMVALVRRLERYANFLDVIQNQVITAPDPKSVAIASKPVIQGEIPDTPLESVDQQVTPIQKYPGEEGNDADAS